MQVDRSIFAALIDLDVEIESVAFVQTGKPAPLYRADMHKCVGLPVIPLDETETLHGIEELHRPAGALTGKLTTWAALSAAAISATKATRTRLTRLARTVSHRQRFTVNLEISRGNLAAAIDQRKAQRLPFGQAGQPGLLDGADVHEDIFRAIIAHDETEALLSIKEFYNASAFANDLRGHSAARATACATATEPATTTSTIAEATAAAEAASITETATVTKASAEAPGTRIRETAKIVAAETVPFILAASAASPVETHP